MVMRTAEPRLAGFSSQTQPGGKLYQMNYIPTMSIINPSRFSKNIINCYITLRVRKYIVIAMTFAMIKALYAQMPIPSRDIQTSMKELADESLITNCPDIIPIWSTNHSIIKVTIQSSIPNAEIQYTLSNIDSSSKGVSNTKYFVYRTPLLITNSVRIFAQAVMKSGAFKEYAKEVGDKYAQQQENHNEELDLAANGLDEKAIQEAMKTNKPTAIEERYKLTSKELNGTQLVSVGKSSSLDLSFEDNGNIGIIDAWKTYYFHSDVVNPNDLAPSGRGTIKQAYDSGQNPIDFYEGEIPNLSIVSGNSQVGVQGTLLKNPLVVLVTDKYKKPLINAPLHFEIDYEGGGIIKNTNDNLDAFADSSTDSNGKASISFILLCYATNKSLINCTATSGDKSTNVTFTESSDTNLANSNSISLYNMVSNVNPDGSMEVHWANNTASYDTNNIVLSYETKDGKIATEAVVPAHSTYAHVPNIK